jgi:hypothetical protein
MRFLRGLGGVLLWIVASLIGLLGAVLCVTIILLPLGIPVLLVARRMFGISTKLLLPREMTHPVDEASKSLRKTRKKAGKKLEDAPGTDDVADAGKKARKRVRKGGRRLRKQLAG